MKIKQIDPEIIEAMSTVDYDFYEQPMLDFIATLGLTGMAIDVGAHVGNHSVYFATRCRFDTVLAFEPNPEAKHAFRENTRDIINIVLHGKAVTDRPMFYSVDINKECPGQTKVSTSLGALVSTTVDDTVSIRECFHPNTPVSLIKIDVEGMEIDVIKGASLTIARYKPHLFVEHFGDPDELLRYLPNGYRVGQRFNGAPTYHLYYE